MNIAKEKRGLFSFKKKSTEEIVKNMQEVSNIVLSKLNEDIVQLEKTRINPYTNPRMALELFKEMKELREENQSLKNNQLKQKIDIFLKEKGIEDEKISLLIQEFMER